MASALRERATKAGRVPIAIVSPFVDKRHGTERCLAAQIERLSGDYEIHLFSCRVEDIDLSQITWHRVREIPGPHLAKYLFWFLANEYSRRREQRRMGRPFGLVYSPGINCRDADLIQVHIVFAEFHRQVRPSLSLFGNPVRSWPRQLHRRLYYRLILQLEKRLYKREEVTLVGICGKTMEDLKRYYGTRSPVPVIFHGIDASQFSPERRKEMREGARRGLGLGGKDFAVLLVGNDWRSKGLDCLLAALRQVARPRLQLLIVGSDDPRPFERELASLPTPARILPIRGDVEYYYAAADLLVAPSVEDAFSLPPLEAMGAGLPVIVSGNAGVSEIVTHGCDGLILEDPTDTERFAELLKQVMDDEALRDRLGWNGAETARKFTWDANAEQMRRVIQDCLSRKDGIFARS